MAGPEPARRPAPSDIAAMAGLVGTLDDLTDQLVEMILERLGKPFDEYVEIGPERPGKDAAYTLDSFKLRTELGWQDKISLGEGLDDVIAWARRFEKDLPNLPSSYVHKA